MTDLHTHILPFMDDGAKDEAESLSMLREESRQGVHTVALTPHFYLWNEELPDFLARRDGSLRRLRHACQQAEPAEKATLPRVIVGAEVAWFPTLKERKELDQLCYSGTNILLVELPMARWEKDLAYKLVDLAEERELLLLLAHFDRYWGLQDKRQYREIAELGFPLQISSGAFLSLLLRKNAFSLMKQGGFVVSDCHHPVHRPPNLGAAQTAIRKKAGDFAEEVMRHTDILLPEEAEFLSLIDP